MYTNWLVDYFLVGIASFFVTYWQTNKIVGSQARALRQEREKAVTKKRERNNQQVCLSYDKHENSFALSGDQDEIQRILSDLSRISQGTTPPIKVCPQPSRTSNNTPPIPSPPPLHPVMTKTSTQQQHFPLAVPQNAEPKTRWHIHWQEGVGRRSR